ncbi:MAG: queuosine precursor transporter [Candidatus Aerophobetes bacterium]|nr:queuosine precursor transporter [Candidatus Aerophobetes bacterium]
MYKERNSPFIILCSIFVGSLVISEILAAKIVAFYGIYFPAGVLAYAVTFTITDIIGEIWGKDYAKQVVFAGFLTLAVIILLIWISIFLPAAPFWKDKDAFIAILGIKKGATRITIASIAAYLVSQYHDVWAFNFWRRITKKKHLWLRNNASTLVSQAIDTSLFISLAFYGVVPVLPLILGQYFVKLCIALLDTPVVYLFVYLIKRPKKAGLKGRIRGLEGKMQD